MGNSAFAIDNLGAFLSFFPFRSLNKMCHLGERDKRGVRSLFMWTTDPSIFFLGDIIARPNKESNLLARSLRASSDCQGSCFH